MNKDSGYIQNWNRMFSWGQDVSPGGASYRVVREEKVMKEMMLKIYKIC